MTNINYDDLHRLIAYTRPTVSTTYTFTYSAIGNMTRNDELSGGSSYAYPATGQPHPHAVTSAGGRAYSYDSCGNMTNRNGWALLYDEENQLKQVAGTNTVTFGYSDGGQRLWKLSGGQYTIYIGGIYEIKAGKTLCHVFVGGKRVATFEPSGQFCTWLYQHPWLSGPYDAVIACLNWPFQQGRTPLTATLLPLLGVLCASVGSRWRRRLACGASRLFGGASVPACGRFAFGSSLQRRYSRLALRPSPFWMQCISVLLIVAFFLAVTPTQVQAATCSPVFWYYHSDHLGSSSIMTDRQGQLVKHYEYFTFGKDKYTDATCPAFNVSNRYTGQVLDEDTGLYYYNSRYYDPELGRFIQPDSIVPNAGDPQSLNRYSYCGNNPLKYVDPSGHFFQVIAAAFMYGGLTSGASANGVYSAAYGAGMAAGISAIRGGDVLQSAYAGAFVGGWAGLTSDNTQRIIIQAGNAILSVAAIVVGAMLLPGAGGWVIAEAVLSMSSGGLGLASQGAGLAGDPGLSQNLGYAAMAAGAAAATIGIARAVIAGHTPAQQAGQTSNATSVNQSDNPFHAELKLQVDDPSPGLQFKIDGLSPNKYMNAMFEKGDIILEAQRWNATSRGWRWSNQCFDQNYALQQHLETQGYKYWSFRMIGGSKWHGLINHNILAVDPSGWDGSAFTIDVFKYTTLRNAVKIGTPEQFFKSYPGPVGTE